MWCDFNFDEIQIDADKQINKQVRGKAENC